MILGVQVLPTSLHKCLNLMCTTVYDIHVQKMLTAIKCYVTLFFWKFNPSTPINVMSLDTFVMLIYTDPYTPTHIGLCHYEMLANTVPLLCNYGLYWFGIDPIHSLHEL